MSPPMSQALKQSARKGKMSATQTEQLHPIEIASEQLLLEKKLLTATKPTFKQLAKNPPRTRNAPLKEMELSVTISVGNDDINMEHLAKVDEFLQKECISGLCSVERGGGMLRLHLQMVCRLLTSSAAMVSKKLKHYLGWEDPQRAPPGHHILTKALRNQGLHTYIGMIGYCIKDKGEDHFQCIHKDISDTQLEEGVEEYIKFGTPFAKNRVILTHKNLLERAATYCRYKLRKQLGSTLPGTLLPMLQSGQYIPSASWVLPVRQGGMEFNRAVALWKCMMNPQSVEMQDVTQIFFEHTNPGSRLADLGRQRLAVELEESREGAAHEYDIPAKNPVPVAHRTKSCIVLDVSQDNSLPNEIIMGTQPDDHHVTKCPALYIPVVYGDRDNANDLTM